jgi:hypothetical protein
VAECVAVLSPAQNETELVDFEKPAERARAQLPLQEMGNGERTGAAATQVEQPAQPSEAEPAVEAPAAKGTASEHPAEIEPAYGRRPTDQDFESIRLPRQGARETLIADLRAQQRAARMSPPPTIFALPVDVPDVVARDGAAAAVPPLRLPPARRPAPLTEPTFAAMQPRLRVKSRRGLYIVLSLLILATLAFATWLAYQQRSRFGSVEQELLPATLVPPPVFRNNVVPLPYSVAVEAHQELPLAVERVQSLRAEEQDIGFYIAPIQVDSVLYYRIMAGPVADSAEASALLRRLLEKGHKTGATQWDVRQSPLAFILGDYDTRSAAEAREREAARLSIPAYVVPVPGPDGGTRQRVYAGAYAGFAEAGIMRQLLRSAGLPDSLVQRVGTRR